MGKALKRPSTALFPVPVVLVTCVDDTGKANIITLAWAGNVCSDPPQIGISIRPSRHSHGLIAVSKEFVVNIPSAEIVKETDYCGTVSGRDADKFAETGFTALPASEVRAPLIKECPVNIECRVKEVVSLGTHDLFIGEVLAVHIDEEFLDEEGRADISKVNPFTYNHEEYWTLKEKIGSYGYTKKD
jgi:flavin reductase (DIM6/NTAB) family NADH-FMN oxidoreductase RutF